MLPLAAFFMELAMSTIAELTGKISLDGVQFINEQRRIVSMSDQLSIRFDKLKQSASSYSKKLASISSEVKNFAQAQKSITAAIQVSSSSMQKLSQPIESTGRLFRRLREDVKQSKTALEKFGNVSLNNSSLRDVGRLRTELKRLQHELKNNSQFSINVKITDSAIFFSEHQRLILALEKLSVKLTKACGDIQKYGRQFKSVASVTKEWSNIQGKTVAGLEKMTTSSHGSSEAAAKLTSQIRDLNKEIGQLKTSSKEVANTGFGLKTQKEVKLLRQEVGGLKTDIEGVKAATSPLKDAFAGVARYAVGIFSIREAKSMLDTYTTLTNRVKLVTDSEKELKDVRAGLAQISAKTGQNLDATAAIYQRLAQASDQNGLSGQKLLTVTELISKAMVIGGGSAQSQEAALIQLGQAMASGTLRGQELNSVMEQAPGLAMAIAKGMGISVGALRTLGANGKITSQQLADAILKQSNQIESDFSKTSRTIDQALQNIKTQLTMFIGGSSDATGAAKMLTAALQTVANNIDLIAVAVMGFLGIKLAAYLLATTAEVVTFTAALVAQAAVATKAAQANGVYAVSLGAIKGSAAVQNILTIKNGFAQIGAAVSAVSATTVGAFALTASAAAAAGFAVYEAGKSIYALFNGQDPHNAISDTFDNLLKKIGFLKNDTDTLGTRLYDLLHNSDGTFRISGLFTWKTDQEEREEKEHEEKQKDPKTADLSKEAVDLREKLQKLAESTQKTADELGKSKQQLVVKNAEDTLALMKTKTKNEAELKAAEELVAKVKAASSKIEVGELSESITKAHDKIEESVKNFGKTSEQIEISKQQIALETMARKGATAAEVASAKAKVEDTQKLYEHQQALETEKKNREENNKYLQDMRTKASELAAELTGGKDGLIAFQLASRNATAEKIREAQTTNKLVEQLQAQLQVSQTLTGLQDQVAKLGMNDTQKQLYDLQKQGATTQQLNMAKAYLDQIERSKQLQDKTKKAAEKLDTAANSLTETAKVAGNVSMFSKEARAKEEAEWDRKRQAERESDSIGYLTGKDRIEDLTVGKLNLSSMPVNLKEADKLTGGKAGVFDLVQTPKIEAQSLLVNNKLTDDAAYKGSGNNSSSKATETLKIDFSYNRKNISGEILTNPDFKKAFMAFFGEIVRDLAKNTA